MHRPGYVQGGQEVSFGYLLLGVYYRRIPGATGGRFKCLQSKICFSPQYPDKKTLRTTQVSSVSSFLCIKLFYFFILAPRT
jgi:hypothetical protein